MRRNVSQGICRQEATQQRLAVDKEPIANDARPKEIAIAILIQSIQQLAREGHRSKMGTVGGGAVRRVAYGRSKRDE
jgi:hypothetical protein